MSKETSSTAHNEARSAQMREESKDNAQAQQQIEAQRVLASAVQRERSIQAQEKQVTDLIPPGMTRDQLLDRIREMRNVKVEESPHDYYLSPEQRAQIEAEQEEGRRMTANAEAEAQRQADARALAVAQIEQAEMTPVYHPNPDRQEQYPAIKATLGKPSTPPPAPMKQIK